MTRPSQKESERRTVGELLSALGITPDKLEASEQPDFMLTLHDRTVGVEVTVYRSGKTVGGAGVKRRKRREVEAEWESLRLALREFRAAQPDISNIAVGLMFQNVVPPRGEHQQFMEEVAAFIRSREIRSDRTRWCKFASPLMKKYLHTLVLNKSEFAEWYSIIDAGWVAGVADSNLPEIVAEKATKIYRPSDELWLIIQCSHRISETVILSVDDLNAIPMQGGPFSKIYLLSLDGVFQWDHLSAWTRK
jgi:hypothetical protein